MEEKDWIIPHELINAHPSNKIKRHQLLCRFQLGFQCLLHPFSAINNLVIACFSLVPGVFFIGHHVTVQADHALQRNKKKRGKMQIQKTTSFREQGLGIIKERVLTGCSCGKVIMAIKGMLLRSPLGGFLAFGGAVVLYGKKNWILKTSNKSFIFFQLCSICFRIALFFYCNEIIQEKDKSILFSHYLLQIISSKVSFNLQNAVF